MWLLVGLGNPGSEYELTRHNVGFLILDSLTSEFSLPLWTKKKHYLMSKGTIRGHNVVLIKPLTYMNLSGRAVQSFLSYYKEEREFMVIHDDLDLPVGIIKIRRGGSSAGHKGIRSIIHSIGSDDFIRLKVGIGKPVRQSVSDYVLSPFAEDEREKIDYCIKRAQEAITDIIENGLSHAQNIYNKKEVPIQ